MGVAGGPKIVREGLVFGYDTGANPSSNFDHRNKKRRYFKGKNSTNIVTNTNLDTGWSKGYNTSIQTNDYPPPPGIDSQVYSFIDSDGNGSGYWYSYGDYAPQDPSTTYTISLWVRTVGSNFSLRAYTANNSEVGRQWTNTITIPGDGKWHRAVFNSITTPANTQSDSLSYQFTTFPANQRVWICAPQMEPSSVASPFVDGTRSSTNSLLDLTKSTTIDVSNVSFDSDGLPTFDGTDDYMSAAVSTGYMYCLESIFYNNNTIPGNDTSIGGPTTYQSLYRFNQDYPMGVNLGAWTGAMTNEAIHIWSEGTAPFKATNTRTSVPSGWHHLIFNWNGSYYDIYLDGEIQTVYSHTDGHAELVNLTHLTIGNQVSPNYAFNGTIPVTKIYNRALTAQEVQQNYNAYKNRFNI